MQFRAASNKGGRVRIDFEFEVGNKLSDAIGNQSRLRRLSRTYCDHNRRRLEREHNEEDPEVTLKNGAHPQG